LVAALLGLELLRFGVVLSALSLGLFLVSGQLGWIVALDGEVDAGRLAVDHTWSVCCGCWVLFVNFAFQRADILLNVLQRVLFA
jgi:hypothetical protein